MLKRIHRLFLAVVLFFSVSVEVESQEAGFFDYSVYEQLLSKYVSDGLVDYLSWKKQDFIQFEGYINTLKDVNLGDMSEDDMKAFWINAYNALTIYGVLLKIPSVRILAKAFSVQIVPGFFTDKKYLVAGEELTLDDIEHSKLMDSFNDCRIHFVIVSGAKSAPKLSNKVFYGAVLEDSLNKATRSFVEDESRNSIDREKKTIYLSHIFKWYKQDFVPSSESILTYVDRYMNPEDVAYISSTRDIKIKYLFFDWLINIK